MHHDDDAPPPRGGTMIGTGAPLPDAPPGPAQTRATPVAGLPPGTAVFEGRFRILRRVGAGGMGEVFQAEQVALGRKVALKLLRTEWGFEGSAKERFAREARVLASVDHPSVVRVVDFGEVEGRPCLVLEWVSGVLLELELREGRMPPDRAARIAAQLADALAAVHERGIVHRDIKADNVMLQDGDRARLLDFGIARLVENDAAANLTQVGLVVGTPEYISPEQALGLIATPQSDLYSLGVLAFRMLTGALPFEGPSPRAYLAQHISQPAPPLERAVPELAAHPRLCALVMRLLAKEAAGRPSSAVEVAAAFRSCLDSAAPVAAKPEAMAVLPSSPAAAPTGTQPVPRTFSGASFPALAAPRAAARSARPKNLALMLTDIKGYTERTSRQTREEAAWMLAEHDRLLVPVIRYFRGRIVQKRGDALLVTFDSPTEALHCGMALQDRLHHYNSMLPDASQIHVRVCVHAGEVLEKGKELFGEPLQVLAGVEHVADADHVTFTSAVYLAMTRAEIAAEPAGELQSPGRTENVALYRCTRLPQGLPFGGRYQPPESALSGMTQMTQMTQALVAGVAPAVTRTLEAVRATASELARSPAARAAASRALRARDLATSTWSRLVVWFKQTFRRHG